MENELLKEKKYQLNALNEIPIDRINAILDENKNLNFVQRIINSKIYPTIKTGDSHGTHLMSVSDANGTIYVYPQIVQYKTGEMRKLSPDEAFDYAIRTGEYIPFNDFNEALEFSKNYKKVWD